MPFHAARRQLLREKILARGCERVRSFFFFNRFLDERVILKRLFCQEFDYGSGAYFAFANKDRGFLSGAGLEGSNGEWQGSSQKVFHLDKFDQLFKITHKFIDDVLNSAIRSSVI